MQSPTLLPCPWLLCPVLLLCCGPWLWPCEWLLSWLAGELLSAPPCAVAHPCPCSLPPPPRDRPSRREASPGGWRRESSSDGNSHQPRGFRDDRERRDGRERPPARGGYEREGREERPRDERPREDRPPRRAGFSSERDSGRDAGKPRW